MTTSSAEAIYARISLDREATELGIDRQNEDIQRMLARDGVTVPESLRFVDNDVSAADRRKIRHAYRALLAEIKAGRVGTVYVWDLDRLYRQPVELEELCELAESGRLTIRAAMSSEMDLNTAAGRVVARMLVAIAAYESEHKADRVRRQRVQSAQMGRPNGGLRPIGFADDRVSHHPVEAPALVEAARQLLAGVTLAEATRRFTATTGRAVHPSGLRSALTGHRIVGLREYLPGKDRQGPKDARKLAAVHPACWAPILDAETWQALRALLLDKARRNPGGAPSRDYLLSGIVECGRCGRPMVGSRGRSYACTRPHGCGNAASSAQVDVIARRVVESYTDEAPEMGAALDEAVGAVLARLRADADHLDRVEREVRERKAMFARLLGSGAMDEADFIAARDEANAQLDEARARAAGAGESARQFAAVRDIAGRWDEATHEQLRAALVGILSIARLRLVIEPSTRRGNVFDPSRVTVREL